MKKFSSFSSVVLNPSHLSTSSSNNNNTVPSCVAELDLRNSHSCLCASSASGNTFVVVSSSSSNSSSTEATATTRFWFNIVVFSKSPSSSSNGAMGWMRSATKTIQVPPMIAEEKGNDNNSDDLRALLLRPQNMKSSSNGTKIEKIRIRSVKIANVSGAIMIHFTRVVSEN